MNTFNRVVVVILLLIAIVLCTLSLVLPVRTLGVIAQQAELLMDNVGRLRPLVRVLLGAFVALVLDLIAVLLLILEVRRPAPKSISVEQAAGGEVTLNLSSIADQLETEINQLPEVLRAKPKVSARRGGVVVELDAKIAAETGLPGKAERIVEAIRRVVEQKMGLKLAQPPKVNLQAVRRTGAPGGQEDRSFASTSDEEERAGRPIDVESKL